MTPRQQPTSEFVPPGWAVQGVQGLALVVTGPSGAGKSSVIDELLKRDRTLAFSVSATTRARRPQEEHGRDYYFISDEEFGRLKETDELLEWATYQGGHYGTLRSEVEGRLGKGQDVLLNVEVQGALSIQQAGLDYSVLLVFLVPPDRDELQRRLRGRGTESEEELARRIASAEAEISYIPHFHYLVINDRVELAAERIQAILTAERCRIVQCSA